MRLKGKQIKNRHCEFIVIPRNNERGEPEDIVLKAQAILGFEDFDKMCKLPEPPMKQLPGGELQIMDDNPDYIAKVNKHGERRMQYMILKGLEATEGLEWETVKANNPETWDNIDTELRDSGFSPIEIGHIRMGVMKANALSEERMNEARERFLASAQAQEAGK